jgi:hypothetical protein
LDVVISLLIRGIQTGEIYGLGRLIGFFEACPMGQFLVFPIPAITSIFHDPGFIPDNHMTLLIGMLG